MRLFVAVPVAGALREQLSEQVERLRPELHDVRWIPNWHMTVFFLGDGFDEEQARAIGQIIEAGLPDLSAFEAPLDRIDWFPSVRNPVVLAALFERNLMLQALHDEVFQTLKDQNGVKKPQNRFSPHISLARPARQKTDLENFRGTPLEDVWLPVNEVVLYRSDFQLTCVRYVPLARGWLDGGEP